MKKLNETQQSLKKNKAAPTYTTCTNTLRSEISSENLGRKEISFFFFSFLFFPGCFVTKGANNGTKIRIADFHRVDDSPREFSPFLTRR